jgi:hypothetical protein
MCQGIQDAHPRFCMPSLNFEIEFVQLRTAQLPRWLRIRTGVTRRSNLSEVRGATGPLGPEQDWRTLVPSNKAVKRASP